MASPLDMELMLELERRTRAPRGASHGFSGAGGTSALGRLYQRRAADARAEAARINAQNAAAEERRLRDLGWANTPPGARAPQPPSAPGPASAVPALSLLPGAGVAELGITALEGRDPTAGQYGAAALDLIPGGKTLGLLGAAAGGARPFARAMGEVVGIQGTVAPRPRFGGTVLRDRQRLAYPGIYGNPDDIIADVNVAPESPNLGAVFGTSRSELAQLADERAGLNPDWIPPATPARPKGSYAAERVMTPSNRRRIENILEASRGRPGLFEGMKGWYVTDPMFQDMVEVLGREEAERRFRQIHGMTSLASPGSPVDWEINRGTRADYLAEQGRFLDEWRQYGTKPGSRYAEEPEMTGLLGHPYSSTAHLPGMTRLITDPTNPRVFGGDAKVPAYYEAGLPIELDPQSHYAVGDAHWARGVGLADVREAKAWGKNAGLSEMNTLAPWYRDIAAGQGLEAVPAQAIQWGALARQTGVETPVGAPKLELFADAIAKTADRLGISLREAKERFYRGELPVGALAGAGVGLGVLGTMGRDDGEI